MAQMRTRLRNVLLAIFSLIAVGFLATGPAVAVDPDEVLSDPKLEGRARDISAGLRCLVCQNQSIDDSNAPLAKDLRVLVRERLVAGDSDAQINDFVVARYGEFVLLNPRLNAGTYLLWGAPLLFLAIGGIAIFGLYRRKPALTANAGPEASHARLSQEEEDRLAALLGIEENRKS